MKRIHESIYYINRSKITNNFKIIVISDFHYNKKIKDKKLSIIINYIKSIKPDYILFAGDIIDSNNTLEDNILRNKLISFLVDLSKISKLIIGIGNHELYYFKNKKKEFFFDKKFFDQLNKLDNIYVLNNKEYEDNNIYIYGLTLRYDYYNGYNEIEDIDELIKSINDVPNKKNNKLSLLLVHSPINLINKSKYKKSNDKLKYIYDKLSNYDYFITGHMHNGCVFPGLNELWRSEKGIISPKKEFFSNNSRNTLNNIDDKLLVNGPITTFHGNKKLFNKLNFLFPINVSLMIFNNGNDNFKLEYKYKKIN